MIWWLVTGVMAVLLARVGRAVSDRIALDLERARWVRALQAEAVPRGFRLESERARRVAERYSVVVEADGQMMSVRARVATPLVLGFAKPGQREWSDAPLDLDLGLGVELHGPRSSWLPLLKRETRELIRAAARGNTVLRDGEVRTLRPMLLGEPLGAFLDQFSALIEGLSVTGGEVDRLEAIGLEAPGEVCWVVEELRARGGDARAERLLAAWMADPAPSARLRGALLSRVPNRWKVLSELARDADSGVRSEAFGALLAGREHCIEEVELTLAQGMLDPWPHPAAKEASRWAVRWLEAHRALGRPLPEQLAVSLSELGDREQVAPCVWRVLITLIYTGHETPNAVSLLRPLLLHSDPSLVAEAARALGRVGGRESLQSLLALDTDEGGEAIRFAVRCAVQTIRTRLAQRGQAGGLALVQTGEGGLSQVEQPGGLSEAAALVEEG